MVPLFSCHTGRKKFFILWVQKREKFLYYACGNEKHSINASPH